MNQKLSLQKRIAFISIITMGGGLLVEGSARLFFPVITEEPAVPTCVGQFDSQLGWTLAPNVTGVSHRTGEPIEYRINSQGLRDTETPYEKPPGVFRIVLLGDSRTFGFGMAIEKHFSSLIEGYFENLEVINMGVSGYGVDQELLFLRAEGFRYQPDLVIAYVAHYGGHRHMHTHRFGKNKPRFYLVDGKLQLNHTPVKPYSESIPAPMDTASLATPMNKAQQLSIPSTKVGIHRHLHRFCRKHSRAYELLRTSIVKLVEPDAFNKPREQRLADRKNLENEAFRKELYELGETIVRAMHDESESHSAKFVLVTQVDKLHQATVEQGISSVNVRQPMSHPSFPLSEVLMHINESGNGVLAWVIADYLQTNDLIPPKHLKFQ